ncbi:MAG: transporter substrate-binding domain-containing protein [Alphaproteobacteria bacterium]
MSRIISRGYMVAGVSSGIPGLSWKLADRGWLGFDVDIARGIAVVLLGDDQAVDFRSVSPSERFEAIRSGIIDVGTFNASCTLSRELEGVSFTSIALYDGEAALVRLSANVDQLIDFERPRIAMQVGTTTPHNMALYFGQKPYELYPHDTLSAAFDFYMAGGADAVVFDATGLAALRADLREANEHKILSGRFSKEAMGPVTLASDASWTRTVQWVVRALILAEEIGVSSATARKEFENPSSMAIAQFFRIGLPLTKADKLASERLVRLVQAIGNYKEVFSRNLGAGSALKLERNLNSLWTDGGLLYAPPLG